MIKDFISYAAINLTWFALNFVLCTMPPLCIYAFQSDERKIEGSTGSYLSIMYLLWAIHVITLLAKPRIYNVIEFEDREVQRKEHFSDKNDDNF